MHMLAANGGVSELLRRNTKEDIELGGLGCGSGQSERVSGE